MPKNHWKLSILILAAAFSQGCSGSKDSGMGGPGAVQASPVAAGPTQSAVMLSDLAFKNSDAELNQAQAFDAALAADRGCGLVPAYVAIFANNDLPASIDAYCASLVAQNVAVRSCMKAQRAAFALAKDVRRLAKACANPHPEHARIDTSPLVINIISDGNIYRRELGLPSAVRLH